MSRVQGQNGKFIQRSDEPRLVRSIRLTDSTWQSLGKFADIKEITRADLIEDFIIKNTDVLHGQDSNDKTDVLHGSISIEDAKKLAKNLVKAKGNKLEVAIKLLSGIYGIEITKDDLN